MVNGSTLTLGLVGALALGATVRRRGSRSALSDERLLKLACAGMCGEFAAALHREFGYPLGAFYEVGPDGWKAGDYTLLHAFAYHPSGKLVDSKGVRSKAEMKSELYTMYGGKVKEAKTTEGDLDALSMEGFDAEVLEAARDYLQRNRSAFDADAALGRRGSMACDADPDVVLLRAHGARRLRFSELPVPARASLQHYADEVGWGEQDETVWWHGELPTEVVADEVFARLDAASKAQHSWKSFADYHRWYIARQIPPPHARQGRWPVLLSGGGRGSGEEFLWDGWHRFHSYVRSGHPTIPVLLQASEGT